ncbi:response regulator [Algibacter pectinivorans]|uniref:Two-component system, cell cycle response regulator DivK n=1 Tax=Algibacter pectinivorans TaxID=870482 RepID=A0A1I1MHI7_9FLAO|nr:response regulator [Algibacter pectinivorans]SFC84877.1 two-component system, cell cycle response regulator DivK [Algibacter pectinivorans]
MVTVLIIEDNEQNMYMLAYLLENSGYKVVKAYDGVTGLKLAYNNQPDIILIDIQLPDMDGYEICVKLRNTGLPTHTTIIAVSSYAMDADKEKAIEVGVDAYIEKPINPDTFVTQMNSIYNAKNQS